MALPAGFNPNNMSFGNITKQAPVFEIPRNTSYSSSSHYRESLWSRFNNGVADIGNWFAEKCDTVLGWISLAAMIVIVLTCLVGVIKTWADDGFWMALLVAIGVCIGGVIAWYIAAVAIVIVVNVVMYGFRFIFWNGWTLILAISLAIGGWAYSANSTKYQGSSEKLQTETVVQVSSTYVCTAKVLNIRAEPNTYSRVIGTLRKGQNTEVFDIENGFACISYNGKTGYASLKYLSKKE